MITIHMYVRTYVCTHFGQHCAYCTTHHGLVIEGEALHGTKSVGCTRHLLEDDKRLPPHLEGFLG